MRKSIKRIMAISAAFIFAGSSLYSSVGQPIFVQAGRAIEENYTCHEIEDNFKESSTDSKQNDLEEQELQYYEPDDEVTVIVSLKEDTLLDDYIKEQANSKKEIAVDEYLASPDSQEQREHLLDEQSELGNELTQDKDIDKLQILCHYTTILNGFAAKIKYEDMEQLLQNTDIETVSIASVYEPLDTENTNNTSDISNTQTESEDLLSEMETKYTGKGTTVAILDTGADITHEVFQGDVPEPKLDENQIISCNKDNLLHVSETDMKDVYKSGKIPFAYDYADGDTDVCPDIDSVLAGNEHGTHVASIAAANQTDTMSGIAQDAQIMLMKVFPDNGEGAVDEVILSALEDSVVLGADVINMSLGYSCGFSEADTELEQQVYDTIQQAGISVVASAGNSYDSGLYNSYNGQTLAENPDNGVVSSPASYSSSIAVASAGGGTVICPYFKAQDKTIPYSELAIYGQQKFQTLSEQSLEYCVIPGDGDEDSYEGIDVAGKVALVNASDNLFYQEQIAAAESKNAIGIIIANTEDALLNIYLSEKVSVPVIGIGSNDAEYLEQQEDKVIDVVQETGEFSQSETYVPSDFSSIGVTPDLQLKPEITAVGEYVYAALPFGNYGNMSGTSMAAPAVSGYIAIMKEYLNSNSQFADLSAVEKNALALKLLMSTSNPLKDEDGVFYSPRKIGSGMADITNAIGSKAYLYTDTSVEENQKPKLNLYDDPDKTGIFSSSFHIQNFGEETLTYQVTYQALKEETYNDSKNTTFLKGTEELVSDNTQLEIAADGEQISGDEVVVAPGQDITVNVTFRLNDELKNEYEEQMKNGGYFEGYIQLTAEESSTLSIPFLGFFGDWTSAPLFESGDIYQCEPYSVSENIIRDGQAHFNGVNPFDMNMLEAFYCKYNPYYYESFYEDNVLIPGYDKITLSPNGDGYYDSDIVFFISLLRGLSDYSYELTDSQKNVIMSRDDTDRGKSSVLGYAGSGFWIDLADYFESHEASNNEQFTLTINGTLDYDRHEQNNLYNQITYPITIDLEKPKVNEMEVHNDSEKCYINLNVSDNQFVSKVGIYKVESDNTLTEITSQLLNEEQRGTSSEVSLDISELKESKIDLEDCIIQVYDYAMNHRLYAVCQAWH